MWYLELLKSLICKVNKSEQGTANKFLTILMLQLQSLAMPELTPPLILLGLIDKMYAKYESCKDNSVPLKDFAQDLLILSIIHGKKCYDEDLWNEDYTFLQQPRILEVLGFNGFEDKLSKILFQLEVQQLISLNYALEPDLNHIYNILSRQFNDLPDSLILYFQPLVGKSTYFDEFIAKIELLYLSRKDELIREQARKLAPLKFPPYINTQFPQTIQRIFIHDEVAPAPQKTITKEKFILISPFAFFEPRQDTSFTDSTDNISMDLGG